jgi:hypothetical protein
MGRVHMRVIIDVLTPKQLMFFPKLARRLEERGHETLMTTRRYREVTKLLLKKRVDAMVVGKHGGRKLEDKLIASTERTCQLVRVLNDFAPDLAVSFSSPEMARTSFGLGLPHISVNDSPHSVAVAKLTIPLSRKLLTPSMIQVHEWTKFGIAEEDVVQYNALDPWVWLRDLEPDRGVLDELGIDGSRPIVTLRAPEAFASYLLDNSVVHGTLRDFIAKLIESRGDTQIVVIPRYKEQIHELRDTFGNRIILCESVVDGPSILAFSDIFVGMGGTMSAEAALLGVPTFSSYPDNYLIESFLIDQGLLVKILDPVELVDKINTTLNEIERSKELQLVRAQGLIATFEDPIEVIISEIEKLGNV